MFHAVVRLLMSLLRQQADLLAFSHDGRGLPGLTSSLLVGLVGLKLLSSVLVASVGLTDAGVVALFCKSLLAVILLYGMAWSTRQAYVFSGYLLLATGLDVGLLVLGLWAEVVPSGFVLTVYAWGFLAFISLLLRAAPHHENENL